LYKTVLGSLKGIGPVMSAFIIGVVLPMIIENEIGRDKMEAKKLNR
jgi:hypothetical protein